MAFKYSLTYSHIINLHPGELNQWGGFAPMFNPLPNLNTIFDRQVPLSYTFYWQMVPLSHTLKMQSIEPKFPEIWVQNSMDRFHPTRKVSKKVVHLLRWTTFPGRPGQNFGWMDRAPSLEYCMISFNYANCSL